MNSSSWLACAVLAPGASRGRSDRRGALHRRMVVAFFVTQVVLGGRELLPVDEEGALATIAELFLRGVEGPADAAA